MGKSVQDRRTAVLLCAGKGRRAGGDIPKQYQMIEGIPLMARSLTALGNSAVINDIVLVIPEHDESFVKEQILPFSSTSAREKIRAFVSGGMERYDSVYRGLHAILWDCDYVFIHDGARPFVDEETLQRLLKEVRACGACVAGVPSQNTVKVANDDGFVRETLDRRTVWMIQTPQVFERNLITESYDRLMEALPDLEKRGIFVTDDAMVAEEMLHCKVKLVKSTRSNIKITEPFDFKIAEAMLSLPEYQVDS